MNYAIIATLGPATRSAASWQALLDAGATAFRLNTSHLSLAELHAWLEGLRAFRAARTNPPGLVLDLQGSKWRLGTLPAAELRAGQVVLLRLGESAEQPGVLPVPHADFFQAAPRSGDEIVLNDAKVRLLAEAAAPGEIRARVVLGGPVSARKGITFAESDYRSEALSAKDQAILEATASYSDLQYAISYVRDAAEMARYRELYQARHRGGEGRPAALIAKLERGPALAEARQIAASADALWLCRGDLGAELGLAGMAAAVAGFTTELPRLPVPAIMAGQVLEHMTASPTPTRSEVCYLYDSLQAGYRGFVLSDETAVGKYAVEACRCAAGFHRVEKAG